MYTAFFVCVCVSVVVSIFTFTYYIGNMLYLPLYCVVSHCFNFDSLMRNWIWMWSHISIIIFNICLEKWRNCCLVEYRTTHWIVMVCTSSLHFVSFHWYAFFVVVLLSCSIEIWYFYHWENTTHILFQWTCTAIFSKMQKWNEEKAVTTVQE